MIAIITDISPLLLQTPRHVSVVYRKEQDDRCGGFYYYELGLVKYGGNWRLCHGRSSDFFPEDGTDWKPLTDCSAEIRVELAPHILQLKEQVVLSAEQFVPKVDEAIASLDTAIAEI